MASRDVPSIICQALGRGVTRSRRRAAQWLRKAADNGHSDACLALAQRMYGDEPYYREVGHVGEAAGVATSAGMTKGHDVPPDVLSSVVHWMRNGRHDVVDELDRHRKAALKGNTYCRNDGCEVIGHWKDFKVCPQCKTHRYCGAACQKQDWNAGGHKDKCGLFKTRQDRNNAV